MGKSPDMTSPSSSSRHTPKIVLPRLRKTGNEERDKKSKSNRNLLLAVVNACLEDDSHIAPLYDKLLERQRSMTVAPSAGDSHALGTVYAKCYEDFLTSWIVSVSDFTVDDVMAARKKWMPSAVFVLAKLGLQYPSTFRLLDVCRQQAFVTWLYTKRHKELGLPLKGLKQKVCFNIEVGAIDLKLASRYTPTYTGGRLTKLVYNGLPAAHVDIDPEVCLVSQKLCIQDGHCDLDAAFIREPRPPEHLHMFFDEGQGPKAARLFPSGKGQEWRLYLQAERDEYDRIHLVTVPTDIAADAKGKIEKQKHDVRKEQLQEARGKMLAKMKAEVGIRRASYGGR